jgi:GDPmannose 4,6-dehydratase
MNEKKALIFGITGQDGSYLSKFLLKKKYIVHGVKRKSSSFNTARIDDIYTDPHFSNSFFLHYGDLSDVLSINKLIEKIQPDEIYNLAAQSHVAVSFELPEYTANINALGTLRILESIKNLNLVKKTKFYQAGTSEMFGETTPPQSEKSYFRPNSPYAASKVFAHWITENYRRAYGIFACNGILFNHESPNRGETFVTKKIINGLINIKKGIEKKLFLGNLYALRDWGHAQDYVVAMWLMLQQKKAQDYVISTGKQYTVKDFVNLTCKKLDMNIYWKGKGLNEKCFYQNKVIIEIDKKYFRPLEVNSLRGDSKKAKKELKWKLKHNIHSLIEDMIKHEV